MKVTKHQKPHLEQRIILDFVFRSQTKLCKRSQGLIEAPLCYEQPRGRRQKHAPDRECDSRDQLNPERNPPRSGSFDCPKGERK